MPALLSVAASRLPTWAACCVLVPLEDFFSPSHVAPEIVLPERSSTSCAEMPLLERYTTRRGRSALPETLPRMRLCRRSRACGFVRVAIYARLPTLRRTYSPS